MTVVERPKLIDSQLAFMVAHPLDMVPDTSEYQWMAREILFLRSLLAASKPALEAGATALQERGEFHIYRDGKVYTRAQCNEMGYQLSALAHLSGEAS